MLTAEDMLGLLDQRADRLDQYADAVTDTDLAVALMVTAQQTRADRDQWARIIQHLTTQESQ